MAAKEKLTMSFSHLAWENTNPEIKIPFEAVSLFYRPACQFPGFSHFFFVRFGCLLFLLEIFSKAKMCQGREMIGTILWHSLHINKTKMFGAKYIVKWIA